MAELSADRPDINQTCSESVTGTSGGKRKKKHLETLLISPLNMFLVGHDSGDTSVLPVSTFWIHLPHATCEKYAVIPTCVSWRLSESQIRKVWLYLWRFGLKCLAFLLNWKKLKIKLRPEGSKLTLVFFIQCDGLQNTDLCWRVADKLLYRLQHFDMMLNKTKGLC